MKKFLLIAVSIVSLVSVTVGCTSTPTTVTTPPTTSPTTIVTPTTTPPAGNPPTIPSFPTGLTSGEVRISYTYSTSSTDADGDKINYIFDWADGNISETGLTDSGMTVSVSHIWNTPGTYSVMVRAIDNSGKSSDWSNALEVVIGPKTYVLTTAIDPVGVGSVIPDGGLYAEGTTVIVTAEPGPDYLFERWGGDVTGTSTSIEVIMNSNTSVIAYFVLSPTAEPNFEWSRTFGGQEADGGRSVVQAPDGNYIVCGYTNSLGAGRDDVYLLKIDPAGAKLWEQTYGGTKSDIGSSVGPTADGGYIIVGETQSFVDFTPDIDILLLKTDAGGFISWLQTFNSGAGIPDRGWAVHQTTDQGYILTGSLAASFGYAIWLIKTDDTGEQLWYKTFDGDSDKAVSSVQEISDGGYIIAGDKLSTVSGRDIWLIKTDSIGNKLWERTFGGDNTDYAHDIIQTADGGYIITGETASYGMGGKDVWLIKTDSAGYVVWEQTFGGSQNDVGMSVQQVADGGYVVVGETKSFGAGEADVWVIKTDADGNMLWDVTYGGEGKDTGLSIRQTADGGYIICGETESYGAGGSDVLVLKLSAN